MSTYTSTPMAFETLKGDIRTKNHKMPKRVAKKVSSLSRKNANFAKRIKHLQPQSMRSLYSVEKRKEMRIALEDIHGEVEKQVWRYAALRNFMTYEKNMLIHPISTDELEMLAQGMEGSEEDYFYYRNFLAGVGVRKYAHTNKVEDNDTTARYIIDTFGKDGMLKWNKHGFK